VNRHRQRFLAEPPPDRVDIAAGFDEKSANGVAQSVKGQSWANLAALCQPANRFDETLELNPETVHGVPAAVAAIVIALWGDATLSRRAKSGWIGSDSW